jgi:hypothetical protein
LQTGAIDTSVLTVSKNKKTIVIPLISTHVFNISNYRANTKYNPKFPNKMYSTFRGEKYQFPSSIKENDLNQAEAIFF